MPKFIGELGDIFTMVQGMGGSQQIFEVSDRVVADNRRMYAAHQIIKDDFQTVFEKQYQLEMLGYITDAKVEQLISLVKSHDRSIIDAKERVRKFAERMRAARKY